ncbi:MAG: GatB/YqeY domain-containing protein [Dehalococcoidia bacterium]
MAVDLKESMKSGNKGRVSALRMMKAAIRNAEIAEGKSLDEAGVIEVLSREAKKHRESIAEFQKANRRDAIDKEELELGIIFEYMPRQMSREEISGLVSQVIGEVGAQSPKDKGKVMSRLMPQVKGKADGQLVNEVVTQALEAI